MYHKIKRLKQKQETLQYLHSPSSMEVYTPLSLVKQMLDTLPNDVWKNPNLTWCDPCCKSGAFLSEAILRLFDGLSDWEKNEEKRYNHIVNNMVTYISYTDLSSTLIQSYLDISEYSCGQIDCIITNPELNSYNINYNDVSYVTSICNSSIFLTKKHLLSGRPYENKLLNILNNVVKLDFIDGRKLFSPVLDSSPLCIFTSYRDGDDTQKIYVKHSFIGNSDFISVTSIDDVFMWGVDHGYVDILQKIKNVILSRGSLIYNNQNTNKWCLNVRCIARNFPTSSKINAFYDCFPKSNDSSDTRVFKLGTPPSSGQNFYFNTKRECINLLNFVKTDVFKACLSLVKINGNLHRGELCIIPDIDFYKNYSTEDIYSLFNFTESDVNLIKQLY